MTTPTWVLQTNISSADSEDKLYRFLTQAGIPVQSYILVPFDDSPLPFPDDQPTIFYGSTSLIRRVARENRWKPGVWYDPEASRFEVLKEHYGQELLNYHSKVMSLDEFLGYPWVDDLPLFVRPTHDTKTIVGAVRTFGDWKERLQGSIGVRGGPDPETPIQVAWPQDITREWRVCILEGKPLTASTYRVEGKREQGGDVPQKVLDYAEAIAKVYSPQPVFMLDVCELPDGTLRVIETNCANCSGFYWMDVYLIAREVTRYVSERAYKGIPMTNQNDPGNTSLPTPCPHCEGRGVVRGEMIQFVSGFGHTNLTSCPWCGGSGQAIDIPKEMKDAHP